MELLQLKYFQTVAKWEHMTQASKELCIAQPALSKTIALLERDLGVRLFDRNGRYIQLNSYGQAFLKHVNSALSSLEDGCRELKDMHQEIFADINLAILAGSHIIPDLLATFLIDYPHIHFHLIQHYQSNLQTLDFDLCFSSLPFSVPHTHAEPLFTEEIFLAVPNNHPLAAKESINLNEAACENFISLKPHTVLRNLTDSLCYQAGFTPNVIFESDDPGTVRSFIRAGLGVAFVPKISWGNTTGARMKLLHVDQPICRRTLAIISKEDRYLTSAAKLFRDFTIAHYRSKPDSEV